jgi:hypothetical protein
MARDQGTEFAILDTHFSGMATSRLGDNDATRIAELLGNREATGPVDEVYGIMAASTVNIDPIKGETREEAWERWCEAAILQGHIRWLMLPPASAAAKIGSTSSPNCALPFFSLRYLLSSASYLDSFTPSRLQRSKMAVLPSPGDTSAHAHLFAGLEALAVQNQGYTIGI